MQSCSLWQNGKQFGWDCIAAFPDRKPYMGYYDEPKSEVADWEIKWMSEHGINFQTYCWFRPGGDGCVNVPDVVKSATECGAEYFIVEQDESNDISPMESARKSIEYLKNI